jgi:large subunit ribosomal protein L29
MLKAKKIREKSDDELKQMEQDLREDYFKLRFQHATGQMENSSKLRMIRKDIARVRTILKERLLGLDLGRQKVTEAEEGK